MSRRYFLWRYHSDTGLFCSNVLTTPKRYSLATRVSNRALRRSDIISTQFFVECSHFSIHSYTPQKSTRRSNANVFLTVTTDAQTFNREMDSQCLVANWLLKYKHRKASSKPLCVCARKFIFRCLLLFSLAPEVHSETGQTPKTELLWKWITPTVVNYYLKKLYRKCLTVFWICCT